MKAIQITHTGGPEVLELDDIAEPTPNPESGEVLVRVDVTGVNYIDTYFREGIYPHELPFVPGFEGTGTVLEDPSGTLAPETRVAWSNAFGSYADTVCVARDRMVEVPEGLDPKVAASVLLQGITAHYLVDGVYHLTEGDTCLITAGAGGVGLMATQLAAAAGARVFTVVSTDEKEQLSLSAGAERVFRYTDDLPAKVREATDGVGVDVVYDGVGKTSPSPAPAGGAPSRFSARRAAPSTRSTPRSSTSTARSSSPALASTPGRPSPASTPAAPER